MHKTFLQRSLLLFLPLLLASSPLSLTTATFNELVEKKTTDGKIMDMELIEIGKISLYKYERTPDSRLLRDTYSAYSKYFDYYVGYKDSYLVQKLGHENYQAILHRLFGRISTWKHPFNIDKVKYEEVDRLIEAFNEKYK